MTGESLKLVGAYGGLAEMLMSGYPVDEASACPQEGAEASFDAVRMTPRRRATGSR
jgi:hypothetical protein